MSDAEKKYGDVGPMKKAIVARKNIPEGTILTIDDLAYKRTTESSYLSQQDLLHLVGSKTKMNVTKDEIIDYNKVNYKFNVAETKQFFNNK